jgi:DNA polymerase I-like protein with 3'-5' exonuclease and polymerase domains
MLDLDEIQFLTRTPSVSPRKILLILDKPLEVETKSKVPFSAPSTKQLFAALYKIGMSRDMIHPTYLFNFRLPGGDIGDLFHINGLEVSDYTLWEQSKKDCLLNFAHNTLKNLRDEIHSVQPDLIICTGRWGLYFLSGETTVLETEKSPYGTLLKWRASKLALGSFWNYEKPHILLPILPPSAGHQLPEKKKIIEHDFSRRLAFLTRNLKAGQFETCISESVQFITRPDYNTTMAWLHTELARLNNSSPDSPVELAIDVETCFGFQNCISIAKSASEAICIPFCAVGIPHYWTEVQEFDIVQVLKKIFLHPNFRSIGQNFRYDMWFINRDLGINIKSHEDTMTMQIVAFTALEKNLQFLASLFCKHYRAWKGDVELASGDFNKKMETFWNPIGLSPDDCKRRDETNWVRNCRDTTFTFEIAQVMKQILQKGNNDLLAVYRNEMERITPMLHAMNRRGTRQDSGMKARLRAEFQIVKEQAAAELTEILGEPLNVNSPDQVKTLLYDIYRLPVQYDPKTKRPSTGHESLETLGLLEPLCRPIVNRISELGQISKLLSTYLEARPDLDGRMRTSIGRTDSLRLTSSQDPGGNSMNRQNVPKASATSRGRPLPNLRMIDIPDEGKTIADGDFVGADLMIVAEEADAKNVKAMFAAGLAPYVEMMKEFYHDPLKNKKSKEYKSFKSICHALNYCGSATGIAARVGMLVHEVDIISKFWFSANPEIRYNYHERLKQEIFGRGYIENSFGYRRPFWNLSEPNIMQIAAPWIPSSTVALSTFEGMCRIHEQHPEIELLLNVHDSAVMQFDTCLEDICIPKIQSAFHVELNYPSRLTIPFEIKTSRTSWGDCE